MKINRESFYRILDTVKVGLSKSSSLEGMLYFQFTGDSIMAYNNQLLITYKFKTDFQCFVHADKLMKIVNKVKGDEIDISVTGDIFLVKARNTQLKLSTIEDEEISSRTKTILKSIAGCKWYKIPENFMECVKLCRFAASKRESDATLQCIQIKETDMIASDNSRVAHAVLSKKMKTMLLKSEFIPTVVNLDVTKYDVSKSWIHFKGDDDNFVLSVRRILGNYPDFSAILVDLDGEKIALSDDMLDGLDVSEIYMDEFNSSVTITMDNGKCIITTKSDAGSMKFQSKTDYKGDKFSFTVSPEFLMEMLNHSSTLELGEGKIGITSGDFSIITALYEG